MRKTRAITIVLSFLALTGSVLAEPPASSGIVTRGFYHWAYVDVDIESGLLSILGVDIVQWCNDGAPFDAFFYSDRDLQDGLRLITNEKAYVQAAVWPFAEFNCELFYTNEPLATGMAYYRMHDNDLFGLRYCDAKNNMNAFGHRADGTLYSPSGEAMRFSMHTWGLFDCDTVSFPVFETKIKLTR